MSAWRPRAWAAWILAPAVTLLGLAVLVGLGLEPVVQAGLERLSQRVPGQFTVRAVGLGWGQLRFRELRVLDDRGQPILEVPEGALGLAPWRGLRRGRWMAALGDLSLREPGLWVTVDEQGRVNLASLFAPSKEPRVSPLADYEGELRWGGAWVQIKDLRGPGARYGLKDGEGRLRFRPGAAARGELSWVPVQGRDGRIRARGSWSPAQLGVELTVGLEGLELARLAGFAEVARRIELREGVLSAELWGATARARIQDPWAPPAYGGWARVEGAELAHPDLPWPIRRLELSARCVEGSVRLESGAGIVGGMGFRVEGRWKPPPSPWAQVRITAPNLRLERLLEGVGRRLPVVGGLQVELDGAGPPDSLSWEGRFRAPELVLVGRGVGPLDASLRLDGRLLRVEELALGTGPRGRVEGSGWALLGEAPQVALELRGRAAEIGPWLPGIQASDFDVRVLGDLSDPLVTGRTQVSGLSGVGDRIDSASARFVADRRGAVLWDARARGRAGDLQVPYLVWEPARPGGEAFLAGSLRASGLRPSALGVGPLASSEGALSGRVVFSGAPSGRGLSAFGLLDPSWLTLGGVRWSELEGAFALSDRALVLPALTASGAGGRFSAWGRLALGGEGGSDLVVRGSGVDWAQLARLWRGRAPFAPGGRGDLLASWEQGGDARGWWSVHATGGERGRPLAAAGRGFLDPGGRGAAVAWVDGLPLDGRRLVSGLDLEGDLTAAVGAWGTVADLRFAYGARLKGSELTGLREDLLAQGGGRVTPQRIWLSEGAATLGYADREGAVARLPELEGAALPWSGSEAPGSLRPSSFGRGPWAREGLLSFQGWVDRATRASLIRFGAEGLDLGWLIEQAWLPEAARLARGLQVTGGWASAGGALRSGRGRVRLDPGGWFLVPWLLAGGGGGSGRPSEAFSAAGRVWIGEPARPVWGRLGLDPVLLSRHPFDPRVVGPPGLRWAGEGVEEGLLRLQGWLEGPELSLRGAVAGWEARELLAFSAAARRSPLEQVRGRVWLEGLQVSGLWQGDPLRELEVSGRLGLRGGSWSRGGLTLPIQELDAQVEQHDRSLNLSDLSIRSGELRLKGRGGRDALGRWRGDLWSLGWPLEALRPLGEPWRGLEGQARLAISLDSGGGAPNLSLALEGEGVSWWGPTARVDLPVFRLGRLRPGEGGSLKTGPGQGIGWSWLGGRHRLELPEGALDLRARLEGAGEEARVSALGSVSFRAPEGPYSWEWWTSPDGPDFSGPGGAMELEFHQLGIKLLQALAGRPADGRHLLAEGVLGLKGSWHRGHAAEAPEDALGYELRLDRLELGEEGAGGWRGLALSQPLEVVYRRVGGEGRLSLPPVAWTGVEAAQAAPARGLAAVPPAPAGVLEAALDLGLTSEPGQLGSTRDRVSVQARDLSLTALGFLLPGAPQGRIEALTLESVGPLLTPDLRFGLRLVEGSLGPLGLARLEGGLAGRPGPAPGSYRLEVGGPDGELELFLGRAPTPDQRLGLSGTIPLRWGAVRPPASGRLEAVWEGWRPEVEGEMQLQARLVDHGLRLVADLLPGVTGSTGILQGVLTLTGTLARPELSGSLSVERGVVVHEKLGTLSGLEVQTRFEELQGSAGGQADPAEPREVGLSRLSIERFRGLLGGVPFELKGSADMAGLEPRAVRVDLEGRGLPLRWGDLLTARADVGLTLAARRGRLAGVEGSTLIPIVTGRIDLQGGDLNLPLGALGSPARVTGGFPLDYRIDLGLGEDVWVHLLGSRVRARGELRLFPHPLTRRPVLAGAVDLSRGVLQLPQDLSFRVVRGRAFFDSAVAPTLEGVEAQTEVGGYQISAFLRGGISDLTMELVSNPPLSQAEIGRLLVTGEASRSLPGGGEVGLGTQVSPGQGEGLVGDVASRGLSLVSSLVTSAITERIGRIFFLSDFSFDVIPPYGYVFKVAKALDPDDRILLTLTRVVNSSQGQDENLYGVEWRFQRNLLLRLATDQFGGFRAWFQGIWELGGGKGALRADP